MFSKIFNLIKESYESDKIQRQKALDIISKAKKYIDMAYWIPTKLTVNGKVYEGFKYYTNTPFKLKIYYLYPNNGDNSLKNIENSNISGGVQGNDTIVIFSHRDKSEFMTSSNTPYFDKYKALDYMKIDFNSPLVEDTLFHELIHIIDKIERPNIPLPKIDTYRSYINSPAELNAFQQEMIQSLDDLLKNKNSKQIKHLLNTLNPLKILKSILDKQGLFQNLTDENTKKYGRRIYKYMVGKYEEKLKEEQGI